MAINADTNVIMGKQATDEYILQAPDELHYLCLFPQNLRLKALRVCGIAPSVDCVVGLLEKESELGYASAAGFGFALAPYEEGEDDYLLVLHEDEGKASGLSCGLVSVEEAAGSALRIGKAVSDGPWVTEVNGSRAIFLGDDALVIADICAKKPAEEPTGIESVDVGVQGVSVDLVDKVSSSSSSVYADDAATQSDKGDRRCCEGFCYLGVILPEWREVASRVLRSCPTLQQLVASPAEWFGSLEGYRVVHIGPGRLHLLCEEQDPPVIASSLRGCLAAVSFGEIEGPGTLASVVRSESSVLDQEKGGYRASDVLGARHDWLAHAKVGVSALTAWPDAVIAGDGHGSVGIPMRPVAAVRKSRSGGISGSSTQVASLVRLSAGTTYTLGAIGQKVLLISGSYEVQGWCVVPSARRVIGLEISCGDLKCNETGEAVVLGSSFEFVKSSSGVGDMRRVHGTLSIELVEQAARAEVVEPVLEALANTYNRLVVGDQNGNSSSRINIDHLNSSFGSSIDSYDGIVQPEYGPDMGDGSAEANIRLAGGSSTLLCLTGSMGAVYLDPSGEVTLDFSGLVIGTGMPCVVHGGKLNYNVLEVGVRVSRTRPPSFGNLVVQSVVDSYEWDCNYGSDDGYSSDWVG